MNYVLSSDYSEVIAVSMLKTKYCVIAVGILKIIYQPKFISKENYAKEHFGRK